VRCRRLLSLRPDESFPLSDAPPLSSTEFVTNQALLRPDTDSKTTDERTAVDELRGSPMAIGTLEEIIDDDHAIVSSTTGPEHYVSIMSFVDKDMLEPGCSVLLHNKSSAIVGVLGDDVDPMVSVMKLDKAPQESYADIGGLEKQIQEIKVKPSGCSGSTRGADADAETRFAPRRSRSSCR
jgi:26S proteasome regulatory subunit T2